MIADDEPLYLRTTGDLLRGAGYECVCVSDAHQAMQRLAEESFDLVLSDLNMPGNQRLELLSDHQRMRQHVPLIVITGVPSLPSAIESIRLGIADYLLKPVKFEDLLSSVRRALEHAGQTRAAATVPTKEPSELQALFPELIGHSPAMMELLEIMDRIAGTDASVLITGESGTGKEVVAHAIHRHSRRADGCFQVIDCTAVPQNLFESTLFGHKKGAFTGAVSDQAGLLHRADGGTAFFDELGELPAAVQAKLLRAVQEQTFTPVGSQTEVRIDTRFLCATNRDLQMEVQAGRFRQDLYYRLGVIHVELPPLRERGEDVILLADHFFKELTRDSSRLYGFATETLDVMRAYRWPGNVRELRNVVERAVALARGPLVLPDDLPSSLRDEQEQVPADGTGTFDTSSREGGVSDTHSREEAMRLAERQYLNQLIRACSGNVSHAAKRAGLSRQGLHKLLKQHGISAAEHRP